MCSFYYFYIFTFFVLLYKELLEHTFSACRIVLDNLCKVFGYSAITDFYQQCLGFQKFLVDK